MIKQYELSGKAGQLLMEVPAAFPDRDDCADNMKLVCMTQTSIKSPVLSGLLCRGDRGLMVGRQGEQLLAGESSSG